MAQTKPERPIARLAQNTSLYVQVAMSAAFLLSAGILVYAAAKGVHLRLGKQFLAPLHVLWSAGLCFVLGIGLLPARRGGRRTAPKRPASGPEKIAAARSRTERASVQRSAPESPTPRKASRKRASPNRRTAEAS